MARRRAAYRRRNQNNFSMFLVALVLLMIIGAVMVKGVELRQKLEDNAAREAQLLSQLETERLRTIDIEEYRKYTQTKKYYEEVAKDKLGLIYEDEILFKELK
jgi:cell division protein DivIC